MFDIGLQELILIMVLALLVFGPSRLPELGKMIGRAMREFRRASDEFRTTVETNLRINEIDDPPSATTPTAGFGMFGSSGPSPTGDGGSQEGAQPAEAASPGSQPDPQPGALATDVEPTSDGLGPQKYWAQRGSRLFHRRGCAWVTRIPDADRLAFDSVFQAREGGHTPCPVCEPWEGGFTV